VVTVEEIGEVGALEAAGFHLVAQEGTAVGAVEVTEDQEGMGMGVDGPAAVEDDPVVMGADGVAEVEDDRVAMGALEAQEPAESAEVVDKHSSNQVSNKCVGKLYTRRLASFGLWSVPYFFCVDCIKRTSWYVLIVIWRSGLWQLGLGKSCHSRAFRNWGMPQLSGPQ
jgi:hypothetical protein